MAWGTVGVPDDSVFPARPRPGTAAVPARLFRRQRPLNLTNSLPPPRYQGIEGKGTLDSDLFRRDNPAPLLDCHWTRQSLV